MSRWRDESTKKWAIKLDSWKILIFKLEFLSINRHRMLRIEYYWECKRLCYIPFHLTNIYNSIFDPIPNTPMKFRFFLRRISNCFKIFSALKWKTLLCFFTLSSLIYWIELICLCFKINAKLDDMLLLLLFGNKQMAKAFSFYNVLQFDIRRDPFLFRFFIWYLFRFAPRIFTFWKWLGSCSCDHNVSSL